MGINNDDWELPEALLQEAYPRRGGGSRPPLRTQLAPARKLWSLVEPQVKSLLADGDHETPLVDAAQQWMSDPQTAQPLGAAVTATAAAFVLGQPFPARSAAFVDEWVALRGLSFAVLATLELSQLSARILRFSSKNGCALQIYHNRTQSDFGKIIPVRSILAGRTRAYLAQAPEPDFAAARSAIASHRERCLALGPVTVARVMTSFLSPSESAWVAQDCADVAVAADKLEMSLLLLCAVESVQQVGTVSGSGYARAVGDRPDVIATVVDGVGAPITSQLLAWLAEDRLGVDGRRRILAALAAIPTDGAFSALLERLEQVAVQPALHEAARRYPERAIRLLALGVPRSSRRVMTESTVLEMTRCHVIAHRECAEAVWAQLRSRAEETGDPRVARAAKRIDGVLRTPVRAIAPSKNIPPVLTTPPWKARKNETVPATTETTATAVRDLLRPEAVTVTWEPGECLAWTNTTGEWLYLPAARPWSELAADLTHDRTIGWWETIWFYTQGPEEAVRPFLRTWQPDDPHLVSGWMRRVIGRFGVDAYPAAMGIATAAPTRGGEFLLPYASAEIAEMMADWFVRLKSVQPIARSWLIRHAEIAAKTLIPGAVGPAGKARVAAEQALRLLAQVGHRATVERVAAIGGEAVTAAVSQIMDCDPLLILPVSMPAIPEWAHPESLPQVVLRDESLALPAEAAEHLCSMLAISTLDKPYAGVAIVQDRCDPDSLAEFGWALFLRWTGAGCPPRGSWALTSLGLLGDDETVRRLSPILRAWPGEGRHAKAVTGLDVLAAIGTDLALAHLHRIAATATFKGLRARAEKRIAHMADALGLTSEELADCLVPDCGLDARGSLILDYGPRRFVVKFDEQLKPYVSEETGRRRKCLPQPGKRDDPDLAPVAYRRFSALKKDVRAIVGDQIIRLETAMVTGRRWQAERFCSLLVAHPVVSHLIQRLVFGVYDADGTVRATFRVAEDHTFADIADEPFDLGDEAMVGLCHPLTLGEEGRRAWSSMLTDYEICQPFQQLARETYALTDHESGQPSLDRFTGLTIRTGRLLSLEKRGWCRGAPRGGRVQSTLERPIGDGKTLMIDLDPGIIVGVAGQFPQQRLTHIWINGQSEGGWMTRSDLPLDAVDPIMGSEILRDLTEVTH